MHHQSQNRGQSFLFVESFINDFVDLFWLDLCLPSGADARRTVRRLGRQLFILIFYHFPFLKYFTARFSNTITSWSLCRELPFQSLFSAIACLTGSSHPQGDTRCHPRPLVVPSSSQSSAKTISKLCKRISKVCEKKTDFCEF